MSENEDIIKVEGLTKVYNKTLTAVDHVNFNVKKGETFGLLGPNGAGKRMILINISRKERTQIGKRHN